MSKHLQLSQNFSIFQNGKIAINFPKLIFYHFFQLFYHSSQLFQEKVDRLFKNFSFKLLQTIQNFKTIPEFSEIKFFSTLPIFPTLLKIKFAYFSPQTSFFPTPSSFSQVPSSYPRSSTLQRLQPSKNISIYSKPPQFIKLHNHPPPPPPPPPPAHPL